MIHFIHDVPEEVIGISVDDKLTKEDYEKYNRMVRLKEPADELKLYVEIEDWEGMTLQALLEDIKTGFQQYDKIRKIAVTGSEKWLQQCINAGDVITPGMDMKFFDESERDKALAWLN